MKKSLLLSVFGLFAVLNLSAQIPSVKIQDINSREFDTKDVVDGKTPAVITFWSVKCRPCIEEMNILNDCFEDWQEDLDFRVIAVSCDDSRFNSKAKSMIGGNSWENFTHLFDINGDFKRAMNFSYEPQVFVIDPNGKIVYSHSGENPGIEEEVFEALKKASL